MSKVCHIFFFFFHIEKVMVMGKGQPEKAREYMNWCFQIGVPVKTLENPLDCKEIQPVHPKENQSWVFIGRTDAETEAPILWPPDVKCWLIRKDSDAGKDQRQEEKGRTEDEMVGWHHRLNGHEFEQALGDGEGQGSLSMGLQRAGDNWETEQQLW